MAQGLAKEVLRHLPHCTAPARLDNASLKKVVIEGVREALVALSSPLQQAQQAKQTQQSPLQPLQPRPT